MTCVSCAMQTAGQAQTDTHSTFMRGLLFGVGGALIGLILYSAVGIITGLEIGYVSIAVGYVVGWAIMKGSSGVGGRRYQITALILTYAAVSLSAVPIGLAQLSKQNRQTEKTATVSSPGTPNVETTAAAASPEKPAVNLFAALAFFVFFGLASPILNLAEPLQGLIGLVILFVGLRIAWRLTAGQKIPVTGPFKV